MNTNDLDFECCGYQCKAVYECSSDGFILQEVEVFDGDKSGNIAELLRKEDKETWAAIWAMAEKKVASEYVDYADHLNEWYADQAADYEREQQEG